MTGDVMGGEVPWDYIDYLKDEADPVDDVDGAERWRSPTDNRSTKREAGQNANSYQGAVTELRAMSGELTTDQCIQRAQVLALLAIAERLADLGAVVAINPNP